MTEPAEDGQYGSIKPLDQTSVHRLHSGQVVLSLESCLKELVENAMDAGATIIEVKLKENGLESIEVVDNGCGIDEKDWASVGLKHHTSKLPSSPTISSLSTLTTFGFRGEALSALCALSESVVATTATKEMAPLGRVLRFDRGGKMIDSSGKMARQRGTSILITSLFSPLPVRRKELERNIKKEFPKALNLLTAYALVPACGGSVGARCADDVKEAEGGAIGSGPGKRIGIRLTVESIGKNAKRTNHLKTDGKTSLRSSVSLIWGNKALEHVLDLNVEVEVEMDKAMARREGLDISSTKINLTGLVSDAAFGCGRSTSDRQFFYVNGRPFTAHAIAKVINEAYKSFNTHQFPFIVLDIQLPGDAVDVNVSPDKRMVFLHNEANLLEAIKDALNQFWQPSRSTFIVEGASGSKKQPTQTIRPVLSQVVQAAVIQEDEDELEDRESSTRQATPLDNRRARGRSPQDSPSPERQYANLAPRPANPRVVDQDPVARAGPPGPPVTPAKSHMEYEEEYSEEEEDEDATVPDSQVTRAVSLADKPFKINGVTVSPTAKLVQTTLDTTKAAWNLSKAAKSGRSGAPMQSRSLGSQTASTSGRASRVSLREKLAGFASQTSQVQLEMISDEDEIPEEVTVEEESIVPHRPHMSKQGPSLSDDIDRMDDADANFVSDPEDLNPPKSPHSADGNAMLDDTTTSETPLAGTYYRDEIATQGGNRQITIKCDVARIRRRIGKANRRQQESSRTTMASGSDSILPDAGLGASSDQADSALSRVIHKEDFADMEVLGQFNLALIIARRRTGQGGRGSDDLFIIDQHASDEKYNFETLQQTTKIKAQTLIMPKELQLTSADEITASENIDVLERNGFGVSVDEEAPYGRGLRVKLTAMPVSKDTVFNTKDLEEIIYLLQDNHARDTVRCRKARAMFAMRACRKSVMFGKALNTKQMTEIIRHMGHLDQPWNCPHGRPTMRHLVGLKSHCRYSTPNEQKTAIDWGAIELD